MPEDPDQIRERKSCWPAMETNSSYDKHVVGPTVNVTTRGIEGNAAGYPGHIDDTINRAVLIYNELSYEPLKELFPAAVSSLIRGGYGENIVVNHPSMLPSEVCVGDKYQLGTVVLMVTGPRAPCPKVDGWHGVKGLTAYSRENGTAGYFMKVLQEGSFSVGDAITLLERPYPGYSIVRISQGLWGKEDVKDNSLEFLSTLAGMEMLIGRHYRDTAQTKLQRLLDNN